MFRRILRLRRISYERASFPRDRSRPTPLPRTLGTISHPTACGGGVCVLYYIHSSRRRLCCPRVRENFSSRVFFSFYLGFFFFFPANVYLFIFSGIIFPFFVFFLKEFYKKRKKNTCTVDCRRLKKKKVFFFPDRVFTRKPPRVFAIGGTGEKQKKKTVGFR